MVDLRNAKPGDVYIDGRGHKVRILCTDRKDCTESNFSVVALKDIDGYEEIETYTADGSYWGLFTENFKQYDLVKRIEE